MARVGKIGNLLSSYSILDTSLLTERYECFTIDFKSEHSSAIDFKSKATYHKVDFLANGQIVMSMITWINNSGSEKLVEKKKTD